MIRLSVCYQYPEDERCAMVIRYITDTDDLPYVLGEMLYGLELQTYAFVTQMVYPLILEEFPETIGWREQTKVYQNSLLFAGTLTVGALRKISS